MPSLPAVLDSVNSLSNTTLVTALVDNTGAPGRTPSDIFKTCFSVIFISVWVSMHPNVPDVEYVGESAIGSFLNEVITMIVALLAPELVMLWAMRQWYMARKIANRFEKYGWTQAHGFLVIMKGIALYDGDRFYDYIQYGSGFSAQDTSVMNEIQSLLDRNERALSAHGSGQDAQLPEIFFSPLDQTSRIKHGENHERSNESPTSHADPNPHQATARISVRSQLPGEVKHYPSRQPTTEQAQRDAFVPMDRALVAHDVEASNTSSSATLFESVDLGSQHDPVDSVLAETNKEEYSCLLHYLLEKRLVDISESEIAGTLNHGDFVAKIVALFQTTWFISKIVGRKAQNLFITEFEVVALSCTCLSLVAYLCWWHKPQRVRYPHRVVIPKTPAVQPHLKKAVSLRTWMRGEFDAFRRRVHADYKYIGPTNRHWAVMVLLVPCYSVSFFARQILTLLNGDGARRAVPDYLFSCDITGYSTPRGIYWSLYGISVLVGALHICRWSSPTSLWAQFAWRTNTVLVIVLPILLVATHGWIFRHIRRQLQNSEDSHALVHEDASVLDIEAIPGNVKVTMVVHASLISLYIVSRWAIIALALGSMRNLPDEALRDVQWELGFLHIS
ncbi:hypothetical protein V5O48_008443 [Marasmius crinis-equi]|uniref:Uncharacterized protein n=1 Tax=Marasmius crinis-equi TaxID=585013 RepID=A0ABR3FDW3_9AGAR